MSELILFTSCFISVFALGFQSLNVNAQVQACGAGLCAASPGTES
jgi:hypothetical protein